MKKTITKEFQWDCAHRLHDDCLTDEENVEAFGKCNNLHGHTYKLFITVSAKELTNGMIINFVDLKRIVNEEVVERFDHKYLNADPLYRERLSTCENQIDDIWYMLEEALKNYGCQLEEIKLYETPTSFATLTR